MSFAAMKARSAENLQKLQEKLKESDKKSSFKRDERYWRPTKDDAGNGLAVIRFLPAPEGEEVPYVTFYDHSFSINGRYYIEKSLTTIGEDDPVGEINKTLWDSGLEENKKIASSRKRKLHYVSNILVIKDSAKPENNGKVFLFDYGKKIFDKIKDKVQPETDEEAPMDVFDMFSGANFKLKIKKQGDFPNYDDSTFLDRSEVAGGDEKEMEKIYNSMHSLQAEVAKDKFKSYDDLKKKLNWVLYGKDSGPSAEEQIKEQISNSSKNDDTPPFDIDDEPKSQSTSKEQKKQTAKADDFDINLEDFNLEEDE